EREREAEDGGSDDGSGNAKHESSRDAFSKEAVRRSVSVKVAEICEKVRKIPSVTLLSVSARDCRRGNVFALVPSSAESPITKSARKRASFRLLSPLVPMALVLVAMIGVTSGIA